MKTQTNNNKFAIRSLQFAKKTKRQFAFWLLIVNCLLPTAYSFGQKSEATIALSYYKKADMSRTVVAVLKTKDENGKFVSAKNIQVNFYLKNDIEERLLQSANTGNKGEVAVILQKDLPLDTGNTFTIIAKIENDNLYENTEEQVSYKDANLIINLNPHDTSRTAIAHVTEIGENGEEIPVKDIEVKFYVQRFFGMMPAGEEYIVSTDEKGDASFAYPKGIPGDTAGTFTVVARIEDNEQLGNVENSAVTSWGTVLATIKNPFPRAVWAPRAPWSMLITLIILFGGVWITYGFIIYQLVKIKKEKN